MQLARACELLKECKDLPEEPGWEWHYLHRITEAHLRSGQGHTRPVHTLAFAPHGRWMVSGSGGDRSLLFWEPNTVAVLPAKVEGGHSGPIWSVAVSPDGRRLASVAGTQRNVGELIVWNVSARPPLQVREAFCERGVGEQAAVAFHPTRPLLAVATGRMPGGRSCVRLLDRNYTQVRCWETAPHQGCIALAWSPDGRCLAASFVPLGLSDPPGPVVVCDPDKDAILHSFSPHESKTLALAYSADSRKLVTAGTDQVIRIWDAQDHTLLQSLLGHMGAVNALAFTLNNRLVSASNDTTVRVWDPNTGKELSQRRGHYSPVLTVAVNPLTGLTYSGSGDLTIRAWRLEKPTQEADYYPLHKPGTAATSIAFSPDEAALVSVGQDGAVWRMDLTGKTRPHKLLQEQRPLRQVRFLPGSHTLLVAGGAAEAGQDDGNLRLLDVRDGRLCDELATGLAVVFSLSLSAEGRRLSIVGQTRKVETMAQIWDMTARRQIDESPVEGAVAAQLFAGGTKLLVLIGGREDHEKASFRTYDLSDGRRLRDRDGNSPRDVALVGMGPRFAVFTRDERFLFAGGRNQCLGFYQVRRMGKPIISDSSLHGHAGTIHNATLSPDERLIATASEDETIRLWNRKTQTELLVLRGDRSPMIDVAFSPTGGAVGSSPGERDGTCLGRSADADFRFPPVKKRLDPLLFRSSSTRGE